MEEAPPLLGAWRNGPPHVRQETPTFDGMDRTVNPLFQPSPIGNWADLVEEERGPVGDLPALIREPREDVGGNEEEETEAEEVNLSSLLRPEFRPTLQRQDGRTDLEREDDGIPIITPIQSFVEEPPQQGEEERAGLEELEDLLPPIPPPLIAFQLLMEDPSLLSQPPPPPISAAALAAARGRRREARTEPLDLRMRQARDLPRRPPSYSRSPPPPYEGREGDGVERERSRRRRRSPPRQRRRRRDCSCAGWALALWLWGWISLYMSEAASQSRSENVTMKPLAQVFLSKVSNMGPARELSLSEAAQAAHRMGLANHTKWSPTWWEPILREQANWNPETAKVKTAKFSATDFEGAQRVPRNETLADVRRRRPDMVSGTVVWAQVWEALALAGYAPKHKWRKEVHVKRMIRKLAKNTNPMLQMLAREVMKKDSQEAAEVVQAEIGLIEYCHDCEGKVCDQVCGHREDDNDNSTLPVRRKRSQLQDWVNVREKDKALLVETNVSTHGRPYIHRAEHSHTVNLTVPASVVVQVDKFDPRMRLSMDPPRHLHMTEKLSKATMDAAKEAEDYSLSLLAYDCSRPHHVRTVQSRTEEDCLRRKPVVKRRAGVQYLLLQEVPFVRVNSKKCRMTRSKLPVYCGNYDHQTLALSDIWQNVPLQVDAEVCEKMFSEKLHSVTAIPTDDTIETKIFPLVLNTTNVLSYEAYGKTDYANSEVECSGVKWFSEAKGKFVDSMMEWRNDVVTLEETELMFDPNTARITTYHEQLTLPETCTLSRGKCVTTKGTWVWTPPSTPMSTCRLYYVQTLKGEEITLQQGDDLTTIFVDDEKLVRLEVKEAELKCGHQIYPTNFDHFFLAEPAMSSAFQDREVKGMDVDLAAHFRQQGGWMAGQIQTSFEDFAQNLLATLCKQDVDKYSRSFETLAARQNAISSGGAVALRGGLFLTPVGEAWKLYRCQAVDVVPKESEKCYDSLPVQLPADHVTLLFGNDTGSSPLVFLEPSSRILTTEGAEVPCVPQFGLYYRTSKGKWITSTPAIVEASAPKTLPHLLERPKWKTNWHQYKFEGSGIYPTSVLQKMKQHLMLPRRRELIPHAILQRIDENQQQYGDVLTKVTHALRVPDSAEWSVLQHLRAAYDFICRWGYVFSFAVGLWTLMHFCGYILGIAERCIFPENQKGCIMKAIYAVFPPLASIWSKCRNASVLALPNSVTTRNAVPAEQEMLPVREEPRSDRAYRQLRRQVRELQRDLEAQKEVIKKLTDVSSESSDTGGGARLLPMPSLPANPAAAAAAPPMEEVYESEILPPHLLKDSSYRPRSLASLMGSRNANLYTNMKLLKAQTAAEDSLPSAPPPPPAEEEGAMISETPTTSPPSARTSGERAKFKVLFNLCSPDNQVRTPLGSPHSIYVEPEAVRPRAASAEEFTVEDETTAKQTRLSKQKEKKSKKEGSKLDNPTLAEPN